ncbi:MAG: transcriptional regulator [Betaproteobacteria bacterium]|nr:transcriptional regulator [Betaproteobacteria bacterium]MCL2885761.1 transcriptional regulator [Betaproteobacteria bacterium]
MHTESILTHLKKCGQALDAEIAKGIGIGLQEVRDSLQVLSARKAISTCNMTTFKDGQPIEGIFCRIAGYIPTASPGRKPGVKN